MRARRDNQIFNAGRYKTTMSTVTALVIEDSAFVARFVSKILERKSAVSLIADSIEDALKAFSAQKPDLVFLDIVLPGISGIDGMAQIKETWRDPVVIAMTAGRKTLGSMDSALAAARAAGADLVLHKPFSQADADRVYEDALSLKRTGKRAPRVLVVDDSALVREMGEEYLRADGWRVWSADTMELALQRMCALDVDLVVTDIFMPGMGGIEGIQALRQTWPGVAVVAMSSGLGETMSQDNTLLAAQRLGAVQSVKKPLTPESLVKASRDALSAAATIEAINFGMLNRA